MEELEEKYHSGQRLTLVERHTLLDYEVKRKKKQTGTSSIRKKREIIKPIGQPIIEQLDQPIFEQLHQIISEQTKQVENTQSQFVTKTFETVEKDMAEDGQGSNILILTPEQWLQYEKKQKEWQRKREEATRREKERKREEDAKREYDHKRRQDVETKNDEAATLDSQF